MLESGELQIEINKEREPALSKQSRGYPSSKAKTKPDRQSSSPRCSATRPIG